VTQQTSLSRQRTAGTFVESADEPCSPEEWTVCGKLDSGVVVSEEC
jgi:hypothetical protein